MKKAISLFASAGIGDIALKHLGYKVLVANELISERANIFQYNYPDTLMLNGDIFTLKDKLVDSIIEISHGAIIDLALVTPPCQGMSKNGRGKLLSEIKKGNRPKIDPRNLLIFPTLEILKKLNVETIIFENVPEMQNTVLPIGDDVLSIIDIIKKELFDYKVECQVIEMANYGIPQRRQRLITIATKNTKLKNFSEKFDTLFPATTHSKNKSDEKDKWISVKDIIGNMEKLDGKDYHQSKKDKWHKVTKLDDRKYWWIKNTKANKSAFDNQCCECGYQENLTHTSEKNLDGVNKSSLNTPIYCEKCKALLPRPVTIVNGKSTLMKGFTSAYKRMSYDLPASAITRNFLYACSDNKIHPDQNRTLSVREAMMLHTISNYPFFEWKTKDGKDAGITAIRDAIGESVPPRILEIIISHLENIKSDKIKTNKSFQEKLFS
jgi:DNA (cytosine-5)-methyltransferase 1